MRLSFVTGVQVMSFRGAAGSRPAGGEGAIPSVFPPSPCQPQPLQNQLFQEATWENLVRLPGICPLQNQTSLESMCTYGGCLQ